MLAAGLHTYAPGIITPLRDLRLVLVAMALNFVLAPLLAWVLTVVIPLDRGHAMGLLLLGGSAGAPFLPKVVQIARGNAALAAALMGLLTLGTIPLPALRPADNDPGTPSRSLEYCAPARAADRLAVRRRDFIKLCSARVAERAEPVLAKLATASLLLLFVLLIVLNAPALLGVIGSGAILAALIYFAGLFVLGWLLGGWKPEVRGVPGLATTARNFGAALVPASGSFSDPKVIR
jgi:BASS family bile acid:Na+ symporter